MKALFCINAGAIPGRDLRFEKKNNTTCMNEVTMLLNAYE